MKRLYCPDCGSEVWYTGDSQMSEAGELYEEWIVHYDKCDCDYEAGECEK